MISLLGTQPKDIVQIKEHAGSIKMLSTVLLIMMTTTMIYTDTYYTET